MNKLVKDWSVDDYASHYVQVINSQPNGWGQYISSTFGQSHHIMRAAIDKFGAEAVDRAFAKAIKENN